MEIVVRGFGCTHLLKLINAYEELQDGVIKVVFKDVFEEKEFFDSVEIALQKRALPRFAKSLFFTSALTIISCALLTFWNVFIIEETFSCDPGLDCFKVNGSIPTNCTDLQEDEEIICFTFVFAIGRAAGTAGGILTLSAFIVKAEAIVVLKMVDYIRAKSDLESRLEDDKLPKCSCSCCTVLIFYILLPILGIVGFIVLLVVTIAVPAINDIAFPTMQNIMIFIGYFASALITFVVTFVVASCLGCSTEEIRLKETQQQNDKTNHGTAGSITNVAI